MKIYVIDQDTFQCETDNWVCQCVAVSVVFNSYLYTGRNSQISIFSQWNKLSF